MPQIRGVRGLFGLIAIAAAVLALLLILPKTETGTVGTELETRLCAVLSSVSGAGNVKAMVYTGNQGDVTGVLIVAEGAGSVSVRLKLQEAARVLLGVEASKIEVMKMGENET